MSRLIINVKEDIMEQNDLKNNLMQLEDNAKIQYLKFAEICSKRIRGTIIRLSKEEEKHKYVINSIFKDIEGDLELNNEVFNLIQSQNIFGDGDEELDNDKKFFIYALNVEKQSMDIYEKCLKLFSEGSKEYKLFKKLIEQEKKHMLFILKMLHKLN